MTQREQIQALTDEIAKLRGEVAALSVQVAQASSVQHHYHYPPVMPQPQQLPPSIAPHQPWISSPNICQTGTASQEAMKGTVAWNANAAARGPSVLSGGSLVTGAL